MTIEYTTPGALALLGSGEYLPVMDETDRLLLETRGGPQGARVVLLPTASGLEGERPTYWNDLGWRHFERLGVREIRASRILERAAASDAEQLALLRDADLYYFSGGDPQHLTASLRDTPAWEIIREAHTRGAVLAGCSAGAMALAGLLPAMRALREGRPLQWLPALGLLPDVAVIPHFDRFTRFIEPALFEKLLAELPADLLLLGIDENTALVRVATSPGPVSRPLGGDRWRVTGAQSVRIFRRGEDVRVLHTGEELYQ